MFQTRNQQESSCYIPIPPSSSSYIRYFQQSWLSPHDPTLQSSCYVPIPPSTSSYNQYYHDDEQDQDELGETDSSGSPYNRYDEEDEEFGTIDSPGSAASTTNAPFSNFLKRHRSEDEDHEDGDGEQQRKGVGKHYKFMETCGASTWRDKAKALKTEYMNSFRNNKTATRRCNNGERLRARVEELKKRWMELQEAQARIDLTRARLFQDLISLRFAYH